MVSWLMVILAAVIASSWSSVGRSASDLIGRGRLVQERDLAVEAIGRDLSGCLPDPSYRKGEKLCYRWLKWECPDGNKLKIYFDGGVSESTGNPNSNITILYFVQSGSLIRRIAQDSTTSDFVVAKNVSSLVTSLDGTNVNVVLCFVYGLDKTTGDLTTRSLTLTCDLTAAPPSSSSSATLPWTINHYTDPE